LPQSTEIAMPQLRRPLYQRSESGDEDRWCLVFDTDAASLFVEHEMQRGDMRGSGYGVTIDEIDVTAFLNARGRDEYAQAQRELVRVLGALFEDRKEAAMA
jgi:ketosteroid isomerase-like protein